MERTYRGHSDQHYALRLRFFRTQCVLVGREWLYSPALQKSDDQNDHCDDQEDVDQTARDVKGKATKPHDDENDDDEFKHMGAPSR